MREICWKANCCLLCWSYFRYTKRRIPSKFLEEKDGLYKLTFPEQEDKYRIDLKDLVIKIPFPVIDQKTMRASSILSYNFEFSPYNMK